MFLFIILLYIKTVKVYNYSGDTLKTPYTGKTNGGNLLSEKEKSDYFPTYFPTSSNNNVCLMLK